MLAIQEIEPGRTHLFLHAALYRLTFCESDSCKTVEFYAAVDAAKDDDNPNRTDARRFLAAWAGVLKTSGSVGPLKYRNYKSFLKAE